MCGIAGILSNQNNFDFGQVERFDKYLDHRGPDDKGKFQMDNCIFFHRRLSIIDVSSNGKQPFFNEDGTMMCIGNGEIYNYLSLRNNLIKRGHKFKSSSDNEIIVHMYEEYGEKFIDHIEGEFAIAIYDSIKKQTFLYRDRFGVKPLYYIINSGTLYFSSDFTSLAKEFLPNKDLDIKALNNFIVFRYVPAPDTLFKHIKKIPSGYYLKYSRDNIQVKKYFSLTYNIQTYSEKSAIKKVRENVIAAVKSRLIADVPLGVSLSGGLDSALVVAIMNMLGIKNIKTFSIGFSEQREVSNEFIFSDIIAKKFNTNHTKIVMSENDFYNSINEWIIAMGEPIGAPAAIPLFCLSKIASKTVKVILNGQGSDELFGGYSWYNDMFKKIKKGQAHKQFIQYYAGIQEKEKNKLISSKFVRKNSAITKAREVFKNYINNGQNDSLSQICYMDFQFGLPEVGLKEVDAVTMYYGLEARVPFLSYDLVQLACQLNQNFKIKSGVEKYILKQAFKDILPKEIIERQKLGFPVPVATWSKYKLGAMIKNIVLSKKSLSRNIFNAKELKSFIYQEEKSSDCSHNKTFRFLILELWFREFLD